MVGNNFSGAFLQTFFRIRSYRDVCFYIGVCALRAYKRICMHIGVCAYIGVRALPGTICLCACARVHIVLCAYIALCAFGFAKHPSNCTAKSNAISAS